MPRTYGMTTQVLMRQVLLHWLMDLCTVQFSFTEDGYLSTWTKTGDTRISIAREPPKKEKE